ncbi:aminoglycoside 3'-phosphotransferase [Mycobacterium sp.]|uniref:aminoglycoside 3'-phosphotransferase n=1 Tax=Mycobacterium sp. TaxID=1785 RepID=UPI0025D45CA7|nr:aminoglycoside 3'-phosphotransferase [Mycobacterium sp.]
MTIPTGPLPVPASVREIAGGDDVQPVWVNELGGTTFRVDGDTGPTYVKVSPGSLADEAERLRWAGRYVAVPQVIGVGPGGSWLHTAGLPGRSAVDPHWLTQPLVAARAIGVGLRTLHDRLPVSSCPFDWSVGRRLAQAAPSARADLSEPPPVDKLVVCHGDACAPNTILDDDGRYRGHVDFGDLGTADRWADLAVASLSLGWNYPDASTEPVFFAAYGIEPDELRIDYYRRLWDAGDVPSG